MKNINLEQVFEWVSRWYVFVFLNLYGLGKIFGGQFYRKGELPEKIAQTTLAEANAFEISWTFMGYSQWYILFIGVSQVIGAWLLLLNRTKLIGVTILIPIMVNIIVFDIIFLDKKDALVNATLYFLMLIYILYYNRIKVLEAFKHLTSLKIEIDKSQNLLWTYALSFIVMALIFGLDQFFVNVVRNG